MKQRSKSYLDKLELIDQNQTWDPESVFNQIKNTSPTKFNATVEIAFRLRINPRHADEQVKGSLLLPAGHGRKIKLLALTKTQTEAAKTAGADYVGGSDLIAKIKDEHWFDFKLIVASPEIMKEIGSIAPLIGRKGYMPNLKTGTISSNLAQTVTEFKKQRLTYKNDKAGNLHLILGKVSWDPQQLMKNYQAVIKHVQHQKPAKIKGNYIKSIYISTTMGPSFKLKNG